MFPDFENPFSNSGEIVSGPYFIGRENSLQAIASRVIRPSEGGSLAIVGIPRIGKSSVVYQAVIERKKELLAKRILPFWIDLALYDDAERFFRSLVELCRDELEDLGWLSDAMQRAADRVLGGEFIWSDTYKRMERFFTKVREADIRVIFVLDEFDHARKLFKGSATRFEGIRNLAYYPKCKLHWITTSRRPIRDIEVYTPNSTLDGILIEHRLGMFDEDEVSMYFERLGKGGLSVTQTMKEKIGYYCGRHPYLLETVGYQLVELYRKTQQDDVEIAVNLVKPALNNHMKRLEELLNELQGGEGLKKLLQILFGPVVDVNQSDIDELLSYGLIKPNQERVPGQDEARPAYVAFSEYFQSYLRVIGRNITLWEQLRETEQVLRKLITVELRKKHSEQWLAEVEKVLPGIIQNCDEKRKEDERSWGSGVSENILDYVYLGDLFNIIFSNKNWATVFQHIFQTHPRKDKKYWQQERANQIAKVRNAVAHHRVEVIPGSLRLQIEGFCGEIVETIHAYESKSRDEDSHAQTY